MDIKTILFCLFIINLTMGLYTIIIKKFQPTFAGINFWIFSNLFISTGYLLVALRGNIPNLFSIVSAQVLFISAGLIRIFGLYRFFEKKLPVWMYYLASLILLLSIAGFQYFTFLNNNILARTVLSGVLLSGLAVLTGLIILRNKPSIGKFAYNFLAFIFFAFSLIFLFRVSAWLIFPEIRGLFNSFFINDLQFVSSMIIDISWTTLFFIIHNQKLTFRLQESEEKFRAIFEHNSSALAVIDFDSTFTMINDEFCKIVGYTKEEVIGQSWTKQIGNDDLPRLLEYNRNRLIDPNSAPDKYEFTFKHKNGKDVYALMSIALIPGLKKIIASFTNITDRKNSEIKLQKLAGELKVLNANKDLFLSVIAHDLRNPFSTISNLSDILQFNIRKNNFYEAEKIASTIYNVSRHAGYLLENLLEWSRSQEGRLPFNPGSYGLKELCLEVINGMKDSAKEKNIEIELTPIAFEIYVDQSLLKIILRNLLSNAIKFSHPGGNIRLQAEMFDDNILISVIDNGVGIKPENIKKLWTITEKHSTTGTANETGSGLGLILCKEFVEKHSGKIWVESEFGKGSTFRFTLPKKNL